MRVSTINMRNWKFINKMKTTFTESFTYCHRVKSKIQVNLVLRTDNEDFRPEMSRGSTQDPQDMYFFLLLFFLFVYEVWLIGNILNLPKNWNKVWQFSPWETILTVALSVRLLQTALHISTNLGWRVNWGISTDTRCIGTYWQTLSIGLLNYSVDWVIVWYYNTRQWTTEWRVCGVMSIERRKLEYPEICSNLPLNVSMQIINT